MLCGSVVKAAFNTLGQVETIEYPQSYPANYRFKVRYIYDYGLLKRVEDATNSNSVYWQAVDVDAAGEVTTEQLGNGIGTSSWYDNVSGVLRQRYSNTTFLVRMAVLRSIRAVPTVCTTRFLTKDYLGSVDTITNESGTVLARLSYDAFGKRCNLTPNDLMQVNAVTHISFTGQEMLDNVELVHMNGRVYDPLTGRFSTC